MTSVSAVLAVVFFCTFLVAPSAFGALPPQQPPTPQQKAPTAEELVSLRQRAEMGDAAAQHALGALYLSGQGVPMDKAEALKWFGLEAAGANRDREPGLRRAFDSLADAVDLSTMEEAFMRANRWETDFNRRSPSVDERDEERLYSVFGATVPRLDKEVKPVYSRAAAERWIEGVVGLDCVVKTDGTIAECQVVQSLDAVYGLDQAALEAARKWRFKPATLRGRPAPFPVTIELTFKMR